MALQMSTALAEPVGDANFEEPIDSSSEIEGADVSQIVSFRLANEEYGVDIMRVQEIILMGHITQVPQVPDYICGLINLRGHVLPIIDLRMRFGLSVTDPDEYTRIIVINVSDRTVGIVVDAVSEVLRIDKKQMEPPPKGVSGIGQDYIEGLVKFSDRLLILLNIENILDEELVAVAAEGEAAAGD